MVERSWVRFPVTLLVEVSSSEATYIEFIFTLGLVEVFRRGYGYSGGVSAPVSLSNTLNAPCS
jgi:hypothetical protein